MLLCVCLVIIIIITIDFIEVCVVCSSLHPLANAYVSYTVYGSLK